MGRPRRPSRLAATEAELLAAVLELLALDNRVGWVARTNIGGRREAEGRYVRFGFAGMADITGMMRDGRRLEVEVKSATGRVSPDQAAFLARVDACGGVCGVVRSLEDVCDLLARATSSKDRLARRS